MYIFFHSEGRFLKFYLKLILEIRSLLGTGFSSGTSAKASASSTKEHIKYISDIAKTAFKAPSTTEASASSAETVGVDSCMTELVVSCFLILIAQYLVSLIQFFELCFCTLVTLVHIRMVFLCKLPVCLF